MDSCDPSFVSDNDVSYLSLDHVDTSWAERLHTVINVHHTLTLRHIQHHVQNDVTAGAAGTHTADRQITAQLTEQYLSVPLSFLK